MDGVPVSIESVEEIVTRLSKENQNFYQKIFIEGKTVAMVQEEMNLLAKDRQKLHNKRHELVSQIIYQLNKQTGSYAIKPQERKESAGEKAFSTTA